VRRVPREGCREVPGLGPRRGPCRRKGRGPELPHVPRAPDNVRRTPPSAAASSSPTTRASTA
jgi:hypothetical protein